jgi:light-regulated signal transduction histidine kinase (bacteriophytochrome)
VRHECAFAGRDFDLILHHSDAQTVAEFELRDPATEGDAFAIRAHRGIDRLRRQRNLEDLFSVAVQVVRELTGFDRVMAYRFRHDASGDVVAESVRGDMEPFLHRRYPAGDIPPQARRLYVINTLRLIADVGSQPVPVQGTDARPLDMSHCVLRSVSPVHIEYLTNMGVSASMSVSIVIGGQLWGMLACHHLRPRRVPYSVRMACDVLAQVLAANVQELLAANHARRMAESADLRARLIEQMLHTEDALSAVQPFAAELLKAFDAGALVMSDAPQLAVEGDLPAAVASELVAWLEAAPPGVHQGAIVAMHSLAQLPAELSAKLGTWCGLLAVRFDPLTAGWLVLLRREQVETIAWGGLPEKNYVTGPLGPRLTPRGSFDVWRETVRGTAVPWTQADLELAAQLRGELGRAAAARHAQMVRARDQMLAVIGHDLRNPLQTISMAAHVLGRGKDDAKLGQRIQTSSSRMQRLISQVLDMSRLRSGLGLGFAFHSVDLSKLVQEMVEDARMAHPESLLACETPPALQAAVDPDRVAQLLGNLLSNARHHSRPGERTLVSLSQEGDEVVLAVANRADPIPADVEAQLFVPFKRQSLANPRNKGGLGLGLYIAREIALGHGGTLSYAHVPPDVVFTVRLPLAQPAGA